MRDVNRLIDQVLELSDEEIQAIFAKVARRICWDSPAEVGDGLTSSNQAQDIIEDVLEFPNDDIALILRSVGFERGLSFPKAPKAEPPAKLVNPVTVTQHGKCYRRRDCEGLSREWVKDENKWLMEREAALKLGHYACPACQPDGFKLEF